VDYYVIRYRDGFFLSDQTPGLEVLTSTLPSSFTSIGDEWMACVTPYDGSGYGNEVCVNLTITPGGMGSLSPYNCNGEWVCGPWGQCINGAMTRSCDCKCGDTNDCTGDSTTQLSCGCGTVSDCTEIECKSVFCVDNECEYSNLVDTPCDDGDECTTSDYCKNGKCISGEDICVEPEPPADKAETDTGPPIVEPPGEIVEEPEPPVEEIPEEPPVTPGQRLKKEKNEIVEFITSTGGALLLVVLLLFLFLLFWKRKKKKEKTDL